jgi:hypothetical protein
MRTLFHGTPQPLEGTVLKKGSYVSFYYNIAYVMGIYNLETGKTWTDDDLKTPYNFKGFPTFKNRSDFMGIPLIYSIYVDDSDLDLLDNPYEHKTLVDIIYKGPYPPPFK